MEKGAGAIPVADGLAEVPVPVLYGDLDGKPFVSNKDIPLWRNEEEYIEKIVGGQS